MSSSGRASDIKTSAARAIRLPAMFVNDVCGVISTKPSSMAATSVMRDGIMKKPAPTKNARRFLLPKIKLKGFLS